MAVPVPGAFLWLTTERAFAGRLCLHLYPACSWWGRMPVCELSGLCSCVVACHIHTHPLAKQIWELCGGDPLLDELCLCCMGHSHSRKLSKATGWTPFLDATLPEPQRDLLQHMWGGGGGGVNPILEVTQGCHRAGTKPRGGVGGIRRAVLDPGPGQASLWVLLGSVQWQTPKLPVLLPGMVLSWAACSQEGVNGPGLMAAGLWSCVLPSCEHLGALPCCQLGSRGTNRRQPVGFLASWCHLLLFSPVLQAEWCWAYQCSLLFWSKLEITAGKCPFFPSHGPWSLLVTGFLAGNSNAMQAGTSLSCLLQAHTCPALPGLASRALPACPRSPWPRAEGCCQVMVTQLGERCPAGSRAWVLLCSQGSPWAVGFGMGTAWGGRVERHHCSWAGASVPQGVKQGDTHTHPIVEVVVVPLQPWNQCWPMGIPSQEMGWGCADMRKDNPAPKCWQKP